MAEEADALEPAQDNSWMQSIQILEKKVAALQDHNANQMASQDPDPDTLNNVLHEVFRLRDDVDALQESSASDKPDDVDTTRKSPEADPPDKAVQTRANIYRSPWIINYFGPSSIENVPTVSGPLSGHYSDPRAQGVQDKNRNPESTCNGGKLVRKSAQQATASDQQATAEEPTSNILRVPGPLTNSPRGPYLLVPSHVPESFKGSYNIGYEWAVNNVPGSWEYFSRGGEGSAERAAAVKLGGNEVWFPETPFPTAQQLHSLGQRLRDDNIEDVTAKFDIVWIPHFPPRRGRQPRQAAGPGRKDDNYDPSDDDDDAPDTKGAGKPGPSKAVNGAAAVPSKKSSKTGAQASKKQGAGGRTRQRSMQVVNHPDAEDDPPLADRQTALAEQETPDSTVVEKGPPPKPAPPGPGVEMRYDPKSNAYHPYRVGKAPGDIDTVVDEAVQKAIRSPDAPRMTRRSVYNATSAANSRQNSVAPPQSAATATKKRGARIKFSTEEQAKKGRSQTASAAKLSASSTVLNLPRKSSLAGNKRSNDQIVEEEDEQASDQDAHSTDSRKKAKLEEVSPITEALARKPIAEQTSLQQDVQDAQRDAISTKVRKKTTGLFNRRQSAAQLVHADLQREKQATNRDASNTEKTKAVEGSATTASVARKRVAEQANVEQGGQDQNRSGSDARKRAKHTDAYLKKSAPMNALKMWESSMKNQASRKGEAQSQSAASKKDEASADAEAEYDDADGASGAKETKPKSKKDQKKTDQEQDARLPEQDASGTGATKTKLINFGQPASAPGPSQSSSEGGDEENTEDEVDGDGDAQKNTKTMGMSQKDDSSPKLSSGASKTGVWTAVNAAKPDWREKKSEDEEKEDDDDADDGSASEKSKAKGKKD